MSLSHEERWILEHLKNGWHLQGYVMRKGSFIQQAQRSVVDRLHERGFLEPVEVEGRTECSGLSGAGKEALG